MGSLAVVVTPRSERVDITEVVATVMEVALLAGY